MECEEEVAIRGLNDSCTVEVVDALILHISKHQKEGLIFIGLIFIPMNTPLGVDDLFSLSSCQLSDFVPMVKIEM